MVRAGPDEVRVQADRSVHAQRWATGGRLPQPRGVMGPSHRSSRPGDRCSACRAIGAGPGPEG
eukprot:10625016-Heterocapsa_arctica.AAC.1